MRASRGGNVAAAIVAVLLGVFIVVPLGAMLVQSVIVERPLPLAALRATTEQALDLLDPADRAARMARWMDAATDTDRMEATATALTLNGEKVTWDRQARVRSPDCRCAAVNWPVWPRIGGRRCRRRFRWRM